MRKILKRLARSAVQACNVLLDAACEVVLALLAKEAPWLVRGVKLARYGSRRASGRPPFGMMDALGLVFVLV